MLGRGNGLVSGDNGFSQFLGAFELHRDAVLGAGAGSGSSTTYGVNWSKVLTTYSIFGLLTLITAFISNLNMASYHTHPTFAQSLTPPWHSNASLPLLELTKESDSP